MRALFSSRVTIPPKDEVVRYRWSAGALDQELLLRVFRELVVVSPLVSWLPSGDVLRDQAKACSWAKWYCSYLHGYFRDSHRDNYRAFVTRTTEDEYACFEY